MNRREGILFPLAALAVLTLPLQWLLSAVTAALIHELSHILAVYLLGGRVRGIRMGITGCRIDTDPMGDAKSIAAILAGPLGSFLTLLTRRRFPLIAVCGMLQGAYNLLPVLPLDGGRVLACVLGRYLPGTGERILKILADLTGAAAALMGVLIFIRTEGNRAALVWSVIFIITTHRRKIPCNDSRIGLQCY